MFIPFPWGRKRFNLPGVLNAVPKEVLTLTDETCINAGSVCQLLAPGCSLLWFEALHRRLGLYPNFGEFKRAIQRCITFAPFECCDELESLLTWNFQSFEKSKS
jgi:hypothetical protein